RYVVFTSGAANFGGDVDGGALDVFRRDTVTGALVQVSTDSFGDDATTASISDDGCRVSFVTDRDIVAQDANLGEDAYVRNLCPLASPTVLVSSPTGVAVSATGNVTTAQISGNGDRVLFQDTSAVT